jgi:hypothetical protein
MQNFQHDYSKLMRNEECELNFGFCPSQPLKVSEDKYKNIISLLDFSEFAKEFKESISLELINLMRFFYISYSFKLKKQKDIKEGEQKSYFYFQPFIIIGSKCIPCVPESDFLNEKDILESISTMSDIFIPINHEKTILNLPIEENGQIKIYLTSELLEIMSSWTLVKMEEMITLFNSDKKAVKDLSNFFKKIEKKRKLSLEKTKIKKTKPQTYSKTDERTKKKRRKI